MPAAAIDPDTVARLDELQDGLFERLAALFLEHSPTDAAGLRVALEARDALGAQKAAHKIKGSSATVGAGAVSAVAGQVEEWARAGELEEAGQGFERLEEALAEVAALLRSRLDLSA